MRIEKLEQLYDNIKYSTKEFANMPHRFYQLDTSVVTFLEELVDLLDKPDQCDNIEDVQVAKELLSEVTTSLNLVLKRMGENDDQK